jgi:hypothetical protein
MAPVVQKKERDRQNFDTKEKHQRIINAKTKVEDGDGCLHRLRETSEEAEREKLNERALEKFRSAIADM